MLRIIAEEDIHWNFAFKWCLFQPNWKLSNIVNFVSTNW